MNFEPASPSEHPPLGVVTVTYNSGVHLAAFLDSLDVASTVILADNGSVDGAPGAAARGRGNVACVRTGGNMGYGAGMNAGVSALRSYREAGGVDGEFLLLSNPDVVFEPGAIANLIAAARRHPRAAAVGPRIIDADGSTYPSARRLPTVSSGIGHAVLGRVWPGNPFSRAYRDEENMEVERTAGWLSGSCLLVRWEAFEAVGGFDERYFMYLEDVDLGDRFTRAGYENWYTPRAIIHHAQGHSTASQSATMVPAHHASAYRYQADRHPRAWQAPLRGALWAGLQVRSGVEKKLSRLP